MANSITGLIINLSGSDTKEKRGSNKWRCKTSKIQHPSSREIPTTKLQNWRACICGLVLGYSLELGCWCLELFPIRRLLQNQSTRQTILDLHRLCLDFHRGRFQPLARGGQGDRTGLERGAD